MKNNGMMKSKGDRKCGAVNSKVNRKGGDVKAKTINEA